MALACSNCDTLAQHLLSVQSQARDRTQLYDCPMLGHLAPICSDALNDQNVLTQRGCTVTVFRLSACAAVIAASACGPLDGQNVSVATPSSPAYSSGVIVNTAPSAAPAPVYASLTPAPQTRPATAIPQYIASDAVRRTTPVAPVRSVQTATPAYVPAQTVLEQTYTPVSSFSQPIAESGARAPAPIAEIKTTPAYSPAPAPKAIAPRRSTGGRFQVIGGNAEVADSSSYAPSSSFAPRDAQIELAAAKSDPFSIPTTVGSQPYYQNSTPPSIEYHIPHIPQEEPLWCWAAAAQQAIGWVNKGRAPSQCAIVALAHGLDVNECCADRKGICARTGEIPAIEILVERFGGEATELAKVPRDPKTIYNILRQGDTLLIRLRPAPHDEAVGIRHMIVVRGIEWLRLPNNQLYATLIYNDPLGAGERAVNFDEIEGFFEQALVISRKI